MPFRAWTTTDSLAIPSPRPSWSTNSIKAWLGELRLGSCGVPSLCLGGHFLSPRFSPEAPLLAWHSARMGLELNLRALGCSVEVFEVGSRSPVYFVSFCLRAASATWLPLPPRTSCFIGARTQWRRRAREMSLWNSIFWIDWLDYAALAGSYWRSNDRRQLCLLVSPRYPPAAIHNRSSHAVRS